MEKPTPPESRRPTLEEELQALMREIADEMVVEPPPRAPRAARARPGERPGAASRRQRVLMAVFATVTAGLLLYELVVSPLLSHANRRVPADLLGMWETSAPRYADRAFEITPTTVTFYTGKNTFTVHPIRRVTAVERAQVTLYTIDYLTAGAVSQLSFTYAPSPSGAIRFRYQEELEWRKAKR